MGDGGVGSQIGAMGVGVQIGDRGMGGGADRQAEGVGADLGDGVEGQIGSVVQIGLW